MSSYAGDALVLRHAAMILRRESSKPNGLWMNVLCRLLTDQADRLDALVHVGRKP